MSGTEYDDGFGVGEDTMQLLALIASCSLEDVEDMEQRRKGRNRGGPPSDAELALALFAEEARGLQAVAGDMVLAHSIDAAVRRDAPLLEEYARIEEAERWDREVARAIAQGRPPPARQTAAATIRGTVQMGATLSDTEKVNTKTNSSRIGGEFVRRDASSSRTVSSTATAGTALPKSSSSMWKLTGKKKDPPVQCVICRDGIDGPIILAPCGDAYDVGCLVDLFRTATFDESLFPPSCCRQPFEVAKVRQYFTKELATLFDQKAVEFGTKNRVYCHEPSCSAFLGAASATPSLLSCKKCWKTTCAHCKARGHDITIRCTSEEDAGVLALAEQEGWKRCPGCGHLVELSLGCYHMTCRCRYQFCYLCSARWKTCMCTQWDENRLVNAAQERVERRRLAEGAAAVPLVNYRQVVQREAENLRGNHECRVHRWRYVAQPGHCEGCGHYLRVFLFHCDNCYTRMCARCRRNRVFPW